MWRQTKIPEIPSRPSQDQRTDSLEKSDIEKPSAQSWLRLMYLTSIFAVDKKVCNNNH